MKSFTEKLKLSYSTPGKHRYDGSAKAKLGSIYIKRDGQQAPGDSRNRRVI